MLSRPGLLGLVVFFCELRSSFSVAVMSVDLGSEWMKVAIVSPGVPMEIALNKESKRKTPVAVAFRDGDRMFGEDAMNTGIRFPSSNYFYILDLLGKKVDNPVVQVYRKRFPYYTIVPDPERGTVIFQHDSKTQFTPEELMAMILKKAQEIAQEYAQQVIRDVVITVPPFFNQAERRVLLKSAELAGLKVLQLINDNTAVALNYGMFRRRDFNGTVKHIMFYDMGASSSSATIVGYQIAKTKERGWSETHPQLVVLGVGYDRTLGGLEMQIRLRDYLARKFNDMEIAQSDVFKSERAMGKLLKEAGRVKNILSANAKTVAQVEGLLDGVDFKVQVTREEFDSMCSDLFDRVKAPVEQVLHNSGMSMDAIDQVILVGAGTRVPKVQEILTELVGAKLGKNLNTDEAAAMGAVYKAADLSTGFKVKKFITKDVVLFPVQVEFEREVQNEDGMHTVKAVKRMLFSPWNPYPQKKILTFNKHVKDFSFYINYGELDALSKGEIDALGSQNVTKVTLSGVAEALVKNKGDNIESKGVKAHFTMDESGVLNLTHVESVFEKTVLEVEASKDSTSSDEESTLSRLGSTITRLFSGGGEESKEASTEGVESPAEEVPGEEAPKEEQAKEKQPEGKADKTGDKSNKTEKGKKDTPAEEPNANNATKKEQKPKVVTLREPLVCNEEHIDMVEFHGERFQRSLKKIEDLDKFDTQRRERQAALNNLESFVVDTQAKLWLDEYEAASTEEEREAIKTKCSEISDWLYEDGLDAETAIYEAKLLEIQALTAGLFERVKEHRERPEALTALQDMISASATFFGKARNLTEEEQVFTVVELETLEKLIEETKTWTEEKGSEQARMSLSEAPKLTVKMIADKMTTLDREIKYLVNKAKIVKAEKEKEKRAKEEEKRAKEEAAKNNKTEQKGKEESKEDNKTEDVSKSKAAESKSEEKWNMEQELKDKQKTQEEFSKTPDSRKEGTEEHTEDDKTEDISKSKAAESNIEEKLNKEEELKDKQETQEEFSETPDTRQEAEEVEKPESTNLEGSKTAEGESEEKKKSKTHAAAEDTAHADQLETMERKENILKDSENDEERIHLDSTSDGENTDKIEESQHERDTKKHGEL